MRDAARAALLAASVATGAGSHGAVPKAATVPAYEGRAVRPERTYPFDGYEVPVGACGALAHHRVWILPCDSPLVRAYRARVRARPVNAAPAAARVPWTWGAAALLGLLLLPLRSLRWWPGAARPARNRLGGARGRWKA